MHTVHAPLEGCDQHQAGQQVVRRSAQFNEEPGFYQPSGLWLFGNVQLLTSHLATVVSSLGKSCHVPRELDDVEREAERLVLDGKVLVCGVHSPAHQRAAVVPLRWGSPRVVVVSGGFRYHLGTALREEPFRTARLWRYEWDPQTDLAVSRRAPDRRPTYALHNPTVDRLIARIVSGTVPGLLFGNAEVGRLPCPVQLALFDLAAERCGDLG